MPKLQAKKNGSYSLTLPKLYMKDLGWEKGDRIQVTKQGNELILHKEC
jgi:antitoxin component of MazEF toxin-antitoxin module